MYNCIYAIVIRKLYYPSTLLHDPGSPSCRRERPPVTPQLLASFALLGFTGYLLSPSFLYAHHETAIQLTPGNLTDTQFLQALREPASLHCRPPQHQCFLCRGLPAVHTSDHICPGCDCRVTDCTIILNFFGNSGFDARCLTDLSPLNFHQFGC
jgi:hypothetical protein